MNREKRVIAVQTKRNIINNQGSMIIFALEGRLTGFAARRRPPRCV